MPSSGAMFFSWWGMKVKEPEPDHTTTHVKFIFKCSGCPISYMPFTKACLITNAWVQGDLFPLEEAGHDSGDV